MTKKGISKLSIIPLRASDSDQSEMISQILFGETYTVLKENENKKWFYVRTDFDQYEGWIDFRQNYFMNDEECSKLESIEDYVTIVPSLSIYNYPHFVPFGTTIKEDQVDSTSRFKVKKLSEKLDADKIIHLSKLFLGSPYLWGGRSFFGIDCSGFSQIIYKVAGYHLQRDAYQQAIQGKEVTINSLNKADLIFFKNDNGKIIHVGIYLGDNKIIHSSGYVKIDKLDEIGIWEIDSKSYSHYFHSARRIIEG